jgi:hypothetical protein
VILLINNEKSSGPYSDSCMAPDAAVRISDA